jgi:hypothetical protein
MSRWTSDDDALALLETGPFETAAFRRVFAQTVPGWRDVSVGARRTDGMRAALAAMARGRVADSMPYGYGGVRSEGPMSPEETAQFHDWARATAKVRLLRSRNVTPAARAPGATDSTTSVVVFGAGHDITETWSPKARQAIRRCERAGGKVGVAADAEAFLSLYDVTSATYALHYPRALIRALADAGVLTCFDVRIDDAVVSSAVALRGSDEWMYWFGAQSDAGRRAEAGYLALSALLRSAREQGVGRVNLGASTAGGQSLSGVHAFKQRFGAVEWPMAEQVTGSAAARIVERARSSSRKLVRRVRPRT